MFNIDTFIQLNKLIGCDGTVLKQNELESSLSSYHYLPNELEKVCSIARSIAYNHPFKDGNKRTAVYLVLAYLKTVNSEFEITESEENLIVDFIVKAVTEHYTISSWDHFFGKLEAFSQLWKKSKVTR